MQASEGYLEQRLQDAQIPFAWMCRVWLCKCELGMLGKGVSFLGGFGTWGSGFEV